MDLRLNIIVDAADAKAELADVEGGIQRVEQTSQRSAPAVKQMVDAITGQGQATERVTQAQTRAIETTNRLTGGQQQQRLAYDATSEEITQYILAEIEAESRAKRSKETTDELTGSMAVLGRATGLTTTSSLALGGALAGIALVFGSVIALVATSTRRFFEQADAMEESRDALESVGETWETVQMIIGRSVLGDEFSLVRPVELFNSALLISGSLLAQRIQQARELVNAVADLAGTMRGIPGVGVVAAGIEGARDLFTRSAEDRLPGSPLTPELLTPPDPMRALKDADAFFREQERLQRAREREAEAWQKHLDKITGQAAVSSLREWERAVRDIGGVTKLTDDAQKDLLNTVDAVTEQFGSLERAGVGSLQRIADEARRLQFDLWLATNLPAAQALGAGSVGLRTFLESLPGETVRMPTMTDVHLAQLPPVTRGLFGLEDVGQVPLPTQPQVDLTVQPFRDAFARLGEELPDLLFQALAGGGPMVASLAAGLGSIFAAEFQRAGAELPRDAQGRPMTQLLTPGQQAIGLAGVGLSAFTGGFQTGAATNRTTGALTGIGTGFLTGFSVGGPIGGLIGGAAGLLGGLFGGGQAERERQRQLEADRRALAERFGGLENLRELADQLGVSLAGAFDSDDPRDFEFAVHMLTAALERMQARIETIQRLTASGALATPEDLLAISQTRGTDQENAAIAEFMQTQVSNIAQGLTTLVENAPLESEAAILGIAGATIAAFQQMQDKGIDAATIAQTLLPIIDGLEARMEALGITGSQAFKDIAAMVRLFTSEAVQPAIAAVQGYVQTVTGLNNLGLLTQDMFDGLNQSILEVNQSLLDQGLSQEQALLIIRPALQTAWELQQDFGLAVDDATQALIDQGLAAGVVGEQFRDPMSRMIGAIEDLIERIDIMLVRLGLIPGAAADAAAGWNNAWGGAIEPPHGPGNPPVNTDDPTAGGSPDQPMVHTGGFLADGRVYQAHTGGLAPDEFQVVAQSGEFMFKRQAVQYWGRDMLGDMNALRTPFIDQKRADPEQTIVRPMMTIIQERDGEREAEWLVPFIAGETIRLGRAG